MTNAERKREAARQHNAALDWPKVEPLFLWFESLTGKQEIIPAREIRRRNRHSVGVMMALAAMSAPTIPIYSGHESIARKGRNRRKW